MTQKKPARGKYVEWLTDEGLTRIKGWAMDGLTDEQIANNIGIRRETIYAWKKKYPNISNALKKGKEVVDREVESALYRKALGSKETIQKAMKIKEVLFDDVGRKVKESEKIVYVDEVINIPADTTAQIFWLKNRKPAEWRDKRDVEHSGGLNNSSIVKYEDMTTEELEAKIAKLESELL